MDKSKLLSIGTLSKLTGVHVKSLQYYDEIGILPPTYVDPSSKYRYYSFSQIHVVNAIQLCVDLDIPLKQFTEFVGPDRKEIYFARLLARGTELATAKIRSIQERLDFLNEVQEELLRSQKLERGEGWNIFRLPSRTCLILPYEGGQNTVDYFRGLDQLFGYLEQEGFKPGYDYGQILLPGETGGSFIFLDIDTRDMDIRKEGCIKPDGKTPGLVTIPAAWYAFLQTAQSHIAGAPQLFSDLFARSGERTVIEVAAISEVNDTSSPVFELRCSLLPEEQPTQPSL